MKTTKNFLGWTLAAALLVAPSTVWAAGFANTAQSATATGMAGVGTANPDEPNSNFYNPASMVFRDQWNIYAGPTVIMPSVSFQSIDGSREADTVSQVFPPPNFNVAVPFGDNYAAGLGVTLPWGLGIDWGDWEGRETFRSQSLQTINVNPSFAYKVPVLNLSFAAGLQVLYSTLEQRRNIILPQGDEAEVILGGQGFGLGGTFGAMYRVTDGITLGLNYRSGGTINYSGHAVFEGVEGTPLESVLVDQEISTDINLPHTINLGLGYSVTDELWLGLDFNYMTWSVYDQIEVRWSEQSPEGDSGSTDPSLVVPADWEDAFAVRFGGQYSVMNDLNLRFGFTYDRTPVPDETVGPSLPDNDRFVFALGVGYSTLGIRADLGYNYVYLNQREIRNETYPGDYQLSSHLVGINVGYGF